MTEKEAQTEDAIEMVIIKNDTVIKKKFSVIDEMAVRKEDIRKFM